MPQRTACRQTRAELARHRLVGYVPDLVISPTLDYAAEFSPTGTPAFTISSALGQVEAVRSGAGIGILHTFIARRCRTSCRSAPSRRSAAPIGWSITRACGRCGASRRSPASSPGRSKGSARCFSDRSSTVTVPVGGGFPYLPRSFARTQRLLSRPYVELLRQALHDAAHRRGRGPSPRPSCSPRSKRAARTCPAPTTAWLQGAFRCLVPAFAGAD